MADQQTPDDAQQQAWKQEAAQAAVAQEVTEGMIIGLGTGTTADLMLTALADRHPNLRIGASVRDGEGVEPGVSSRPLADQALAGDLPLGESRAFLCGNPGFVRDMRKQLYLKGLPLDRIHADPFMPPTAAVTAS